MYLYSLEIELLNNDVIFAHYYHQVSQYRRLKIDKFRFRKDKNLSLGASILLNIALEKYGMVERNMIYKTNRYKKPYFENAQHVYFNISHSEDCVILAVGDKNVGCDIEKISEIDLDIAKRFFTGDEYLYITSHTELADQRSAFFRLWTLKESFMKLTGLGMELPLDAFQMRVDNDVVRVQYCSEWENIRFVEKEINDYKIAVCAEALCEIKFVHIDLLDVLSF